MTSSINPNNIDNAYPVAGQDNDSQGFRDNFTNIKTNFEFAAQELTDLQSKVVLKSALTGTTLDNDLGNNLLFAAKVQGFSATRVDLGTTAGTVTVNYASGHYQLFTTTGPVVLTFTNFPAPGSMGLVRVRITVASVAHTLTLPSAVNVGVTNLQGYSNSVITFNQTGTYEFEFVTIDGGSSISIFDLNRNRDPIYLPSSENLAASAAASLITTTSYFATSSGETATLAAGEEGQIKVFCADDVTAGSMQITVTNAGWKASGTGTVTFGSRGTSCILLYVNSKWFCIGNNGATFA
jgi:hypothetical protein